MQKNLFSRDAQQCRDKWEKLMAGYKEVRDGLKHKDENPYYEDLHPLLSNRAPKRGREQDASQDLHQSPIAEPVKPITTTEAAQPSLSFHPHHASQTMPSNNHYFQPVTAVLIDTHSPLTSFPIGGHQLHHPISLNNISSDELPFRSLHAEACYPKLSTDCHTMSSAGEEDDDHHGRKEKRRKGLKYLSTVDLHAIQRLLDSMLIKQQAFLKELLDGMERKEELRERQRQEREERWRVEERDQRQFYTEAMQLLAQKLTAHNGAREVSTVKVEASVPLNGGPIDGNSSLKKRSKNWKRSEVLELIKLRGEMEERFSKSARRAALWAELAEMMSDHGIRRDGKQCREKWDKLMSEYKDVLEGKKDRGNSPYFLEVQASLIGGGLVIVDNPDAGRASAKEEPLNT
ncbi:hypothetical protein KP509_25G068400 [Ceratopteris richardii]|nr:hypothetical protein KP509_25G068400 [Ceratopteris richardii]